MLTIYNYHPESGEFLGASEADPDPMNPGGFLIPGSATTVEPPDPTADRRVLAWRDDAWIEIEDHRGETWWTADGKAMTINQIGNPLEHGLQQEQPAALSAAAVDVARIRFALVQPDGLVVQTLEGDAPMRWELKEGYRMVVDEDAKAHPGHVYDGSMFKPPQESM